MQFLFVGPGFCLGLPSDSQSPATPLPLANASRYQARSGLAPYSVGHAWHTSFNAHQNLEALSELPNYSLSEKEFASLLGRCRMYHHLPPYLKSNIAPLLLGDTQLGMVCKDYYRDNSFCRDEQGNINLWRLYNLLTGANKSTYIDSFLDRGVNAYQFTQDLQSGLKDKSTNWFLN